AAAAQRSAIEGDRLDQAFLDGPSPDESLEIEAIQGGLPTEPGVALEIGKAPVADPGLGTYGEVGRLLYFQYETAGSYCMRQAAGDEPRVAGSRRYLVQKNRECVAVGLARVDRLGKAGTSDSILESDQESRGRPRGEDDPHLGFAVRASESLSGEGLVRMDLDRKPDRTVDELHEDAQVVPPAEDLIPPEPNQILEEDTRALDHRKALGGFGRARIPCANRRRDPLLGPVAVVLDQAAHRRQKLSPRVGPGHSVRLEEDRAASEAIDVGNR